MALGVVGDPEVAGRVSNGGGFDAFLIVENDGSVRGLVLRF